jgi:hypothetical protein
VGDFGSDGQRVHVKTLDDDASPTETPSLGAATPLETSTSSRFKR